MTQNVFCLRGVMGEYRILSAYGIARATNEITIHCGIYLVSLRVNQLLSLRLDPPKILGHYVVHVG